MSKQLPPTKPDSTLDTAIQNISLSDFTPTNLLSLACAQKSLLYGSLGGLSVGLIRFFATRRIKSSGNWAVGVFAVVGVANWEFCRLQRRVVDRELKKIGVGERIGINPKPNE